MEDAYSQWDHRERKREAWLRKRPVCCYCGEHIQSEYFYLINGEPICEDCLESELRKNTEDYML